MRALICCRRFCFFNFFFKLIIILLIVWFICHVLFFVAVFPARPVFRLFFSFVSAVFFRRTRPGGFVFVRKGRMLRIQGHGNAATRRRGTESGLERKGADVRVPSRLLKLLSF